MPELGFPLLDGESVLRESADHHYLRPASSLIGRLCHPFLTQTRLVLCEAYYGILKKAERGVGGVLHEVPLESLEAARAGPETAEPFIELSVRNAAKELEKVFLFFRDRGWHSGRPERLEERDAWLKAIAAEREKMGLPLETILAQPKPPSQAPPPAQDARRGGLGGKYEILRQIGAGGMGVVYEGKDKSLDRPVAVKRMRPDIKIAGKDKELFLQEAKISASLHHPFIVDIYAIIEEGDEIYLVFEFVDGRTLQERLDEGERLGSAEVKPMLKYICDALAFAHSRKVAHRDLKPSNIMTTKQGYVKVMDFGIARQIKDTVSKLSRTDTSGTLPYMAPEQELGRYDLRSDIFSLGVTVYELLAGELPFRGPNYYLQKEKMEFRRLAEAAPGVAPELAAAVERCMSFDPAKRFETVQEFGKAVGVS